MTEENSPYRELATCSPPNTKEAIDLAIEEARKARALKQSLVKTKEQIEREKAEALVAKAIEDLPENIKENLAKENKVYLRCKQSRFSLFKTHLVVTGPNDLVCILAKEQLEKMGYSTRREERPFPWFGNYWIIADFAPNNGSNYY
jgi:hypothetical protein